MKDWKFAVSSAPNAPDTAPILLKGEVCDNLERAASMGYSAIEVHTRENAALDYAKIRATASACGCRVAVIVTGRLCTEAGHSLLDLDDSSERAAVEGMRRYVDMAAELGADIVLGWARGKVPPGADRQATMDRLGGHVCRLGEYAGSAGVKVLIEVINRYETNIFVTAEETAAFLEKYRPQSCAVHLDTFHMNIEETDPAAAIRRCAGKIGYVHFADNTRRYPGTGTLDFKAILAALDKAGYAGLLAVECMPWPGGPEAAKRAIANLKAIIAEI